MKKSKKILSMLLTLLMVLSAISVAAIPVAAVDVDTVEVDFEKPVFTADAYFFSDPTINSDGSKAYANLAYAPMNADAAFTDEVKIGNTGTFGTYIGFKIANPPSAVMVYDGVHETYAPIEAETKVSRSSTSIRYIALQDQPNLTFGQEFWQGFHENPKNGNLWVLWAGNHIETYEQFSTTTAYTTTSSAQNNTNSSRFWWNTIKYAGNGNNENYYDAFNQVSFEGHVGTNNDKKTITATLNYYVLNYAPIYNILGEAQKKYDEIVKEYAANSWMYTEESYENAMLEARRITASNPNLYDYAADVDAAVKECAAMIKEAVEHYDDLKLEKKTATVTFDANGGNFDGDSSKTVTATFGEAFTAPTPVYEGYIFNGWYTASEGGSEVTFGETWTADMPSGEVTYYAQWVPEATASYQVKFFDKDGNQIGDTQNVFEGQPATAPAVDAYITNGEAGHYKFTNWDKSFDSVTENLDVNAVYVSEDHGDWTKGEELQAPTCVDDGEYVYTCVCGYTKNDSEPDSKTGVHTYPDAWEQGEGYHYKDCTVCAENGRTTEACHGNEDQATCITKATCEVCGQSYGETNEDNHVGEKEVRDIKEATCTEEGYTGDTWCLDCGNKIEVGEPIAKNPENHVGGEKIVGAKVPTCIEEGYTGDTICTSCGEVKVPGTVIAKDPTNHVGDREVRGAKEPNCVEKGYTGDTYCLACGNVSEYGQDIDIDPDKHTDANDDEICDNVLPGTEPHAMPHVPSFHCRMCSQYQKHINTVFEPIFVIVHVIIHNICRALGFGWYE